ncbi:mersacidin/lichenicidin family type 2 lantibiotic [Melittangium boletus]|uniref:Type 2 lantibiotic, mersacidin/lichenicidin family n=1 Tax=Melittangium boletus DSM 14713 TaxID=1294270 RepID=A0A250ILQ1_9BACT|nr:mersacidin/lichenicidin family type 2 lantibiotic [Melittangium boletus]ATB32684.1 type 2 lantibiotic, mersacidin/lichenicidin family [Melittangium boletus DSM 14713]
MSRIDIARAWKDPSYLESLSEEERALVPANPAGEIALSEDDLAVIVGGLRIQPTTVSTGTGSKNPPCQCTCLLSD